MSNMKEAPNRNFVLMTLEGSLFFFGGAFLGENTVVPIFVDTFTGSKQLLGLALTLLTVAKLLPKLIYGPYLTRRENMARFMKFSMLIHRPLPVMMVVVLLTSKNHLVIFWVFLLMYCTFWGVNGIAAVAWSDVFARTIPANKRGQLQGNQLFIGGIASLFAGVIIKMVLVNNGLTDNMKYLIIFAIGGLVLLVSALMLIPVRDVPRKVSDEKVNLMKYFITLPGYLNKNKRFKGMVITQSISRFGDLVIPFIIVLCKDMFGFNASMLSTLVMAQIVGGMLGGISWGNLSRRFGNRTTIIVTEIAGLVISTTTFLCIIFNPHSISFPIMCVVMVLGGMKTGGWLGYNNYMLDVIGEENRIDYLTLNTIILFPLSFGSYFAGLANEKLGFLPLVAFCMAIGVLCTYTAIRLKEVVHSEES